MRQQRRLGHTAPPFPRDGWLPPLRVGFHPDTVHGRTRTETGRHCERTGNEMIMRVDGPFDFGVMYDFVGRQADCLYRTWDEKVRRAGSTDGRRVESGVSEAAEPAAREEEIV